MKNYTSCNLCGRKVREAFEAKWKHIAKRHPEIMLSRLLPMLLNPEGARATGEALARSIRGVL